MIIQLFEGRELNAYDRRSNFHPIHSGDRPEKCDELKKEMDSAVKMGMRVIATGCLGAPIDRDRDLAV